MLPFVKHYYVEVVFVVLVVELAALVVLAVLLADSPAVVVFVGVIPVVIVKFEVVK